MALLGTYINSGAGCMALGQNCLAHSLPTTPDFAVFQTITGSVSIPDFVSRGAVAVMARSPQALNQDALFATFHSIIR